MDDLKALILTSSEPFVIKNQLTDWEPLGWPLSIWLSLFDDDKVFTVRCGQNTCSKEPLWESRCQYEELSRQEFMKCTQDTSNNKWMYFDYKHFAENSLDSVKNTLKPPWHLLGFPNLGLSDTTLWIGTTGAHTPCHSDTYGFNLVAQVIGRKQWILYPPLDSGIVSTQTRIPYEESSIYSRVNFLCGKHIQDSKLRVSQPYIVTLDPGDILLVPHRWWHYVEHLSTGLSINTWIPLHNKDEARAYLDEWLVRHTVKSHTRSILPVNRMKLLNPNEADLNEDSHNDFHDLKLLLARYHGLNYHHTSSPTAQNSTFSHVTTAATQIALTSNMSQSKKIANVQKLTPISSEQFLEFCKRKCPCLRELSRDNPQDDLRQVLPNHEEKKTCASALPDCVDSHCRDPHTNNPGSPHTSDRQTSSNEKYTSSKTCTEEKIPGRRKRHRSESPDNPSGSSSRRLRSTQFNESCVEPDTSCLESEPTKSTKSKSNQLESHVNSDKCLESNPKGTASIIPSLFLSRDNIEAIDSSLLQSHLIHSLTHPDVISLVREKLLQSLQL